MYKTKLPTYEKAIEKNLMCTYKSLQVCHSKKGDINPMKIQKLVKGYVKKYNHGQKR